MTECTETAAGLQLRFDFGVGKPIYGSFDGGKLSSDGGLPLIRQADERLGLSELASLCIREKRRPDLVQHDSLLMLRQRLYAISGLHEDVNDATILRFDPLHQLASGKGSTDRVLASQPTLSRFENSITAAELELLQDLPVHVYVKKRTKPPKKLILDLDTTCDPVHGYQQLSFFNGFYGTACYIPLFIFTEDGFPLAALLRPGNADVGGDAARELRRVLQILKAAWPKCAFEFRADAAFCRRDVYKVCEDFGVTYYIGLKSNHALRSLAKDLINDGQKEFRAIFCQEPLPNKTAWRRNQEQMRFSSKEEGRMQAVFEAERMTRKVGQLHWKGRGYNDEMRVICRADFTDDGPELRFVITNSKSGNPRWIYEDKYCGRCQCENWIKELKSIFCDRLSCQEFNANQFRLLEFVFAYILLREVRENLSANMRTISIEQLILRFIRIAVRVDESVRRIRFHWPTSYPWKADFVAVSAALSI